MSTTLDRGPVEPPRPLPGDELVDRDEALARKRWVPGEAGIWALIFTDLAVFTVYFITFIEEWGAYPAVFAAGHASLSLTIGILNTFFLLTASLFVALGVQSVRRGAVSAAQRMFVGAAVCGAAFAVNKYFEWSHEMSAGHTPRTDVFFQMYYMITGFHLAHVVIVMTLLLFVRRRVAQVRGTPTPRQARFIENCASYWHMVDILWLVILALFYLMR
jgi:nitric oxide reductase NorE protein